MKKNKQVGISCYSLNKKYLYLMRSLIIICLALWRRQKMPVASLTGFHHNQP